MTAPKAHDDILALLPLYDRSTRLIGLDVGDKRVGLAVCDPNWSVATPRSVETRTPLTRLASVLALMIKREHVGGIVIGLPLQEDGTEGKRAQATRGFAGVLLRALEELKVPVPAAFWDERYSTRVMERELIEVADASRAKRAKVIDQLAASYILQGAIDRLRDESSAEDDAD